MPKRNLCLWGALLSAGMIAALVSGAEGQVNVPRFQTSDRCLPCHNHLSTRGGEDISMGLAWRPTMMANSSRDPYWQASVRRESMEHPAAQGGIEDECAICHMPMARYEAAEAGGKGAVFAHLGFVPGNPRDALAEDGVSCTLCHQISKDKLGSRETFVGRFVIGGPGAAGERGIFGPYAPDAGQSRVMASSTGGFRPVESPHLGQSEACASCHTLYTRPLGPAGQDLGEFPEQVPYEEWTHSAYRNVMSCQACHMPVVKEKTAVSSVLGVPRARVSRHTFPGGNFFMNGILNRNRHELGVDASPDEFAASAQKTLAQLQSESARIAVRSLEVRSGRLEAEVAVENLAGHKLPTAYPSRRVWLHVTVRDGGNRKVFESGAVDSSGRIPDNDNDTDASRYEPHYTEIRNPGEVQIYEPILGDGGGAVTTGLLRAARYLKDNRILPRGFDKQKAGKTIAVVGRALEDPDFTGSGDRVRYSVDLGDAKGPFTLEAELLYQPIGYRWAVNLKEFDAAEPRRFVRYYEAAAGSSTALLAKAKAGTDQQNGDGPEQSLLK